MELILASASPRRKKLLTGAGYKFNIVVSNASEKSALTRPSAIVKELALRKAVSVWRKYPSAIVIGADTIVVCKGKILGKPKNKKDALRLLKLQNGTWQKVYTGVAVVRQKDRISLKDYAVSLCKARNLSPDELANLAGKHLDKAGAYAVQDTDDYFIERIIGDFDNVVGLPMRVVKKLLKRMRYEL